MSRFRCCEAEHPALRRIHLGEHRSNKEYTKPVSKGRFMENRQLQDAVIRRLETIGEAVKHSPDSVRANYPKVPWREIAGMRDVLIHEYFQVKLLRVWQVVKHDLPGLCRVIASIRASAN